ncbi:hypothetical protein R6Q57_001192 [Mikania cordata]
MYRGPRRLRVASIGVLTDAGQADRAKAIPGEDTPWTRLFDTADLPTYRLITLEFLSTFRYRAHREAVPEQEDEELQPDIEFSISGQHMEMTIERFVVLLCIYYESGDRDSGIHPGADAWRGWGDESVVATYFLHIVHQPPSVCVGHQGSSDPIHPQVHSYDYISTWTEPRVGDDVRFILSSLFDDWQGVQSCTVFFLVLRLLLPPSGARYTMGRRLCHPHRTQQRYVSFASGSVGDPAT